MSLKQLIPKPIRLVWWHLRRLLYELYVLVSPVEQVRDYCGAQLYYSAGSSIMQRLIEEPVFEQDMCQQIVRDLRSSPHKSFVDVGANLGLIIAYVRHELPDSVVYAFEPGRRQAELLEKTIKANPHLSTVFLDRRALSDKNGTAKFYVHPTRDYAKDGLADTKRGEHTVPVEVETITFDTWWEEQGKPNIDVVKMDTEGAELLILRGAGRLLQHARPVLYLEIEPKNLVAYPYGAEDIVKHLHGYSYTVYTLGGSEVTDTNLQECLAGCDTFRCVPR